MKVQKGVDAHRDSISDPVHYGPSAHIRLCCSDMILETFEKLRGREIDNCDRVLDLGCGLRKMIDPLWVNNNRNASYVLGLDVDYGNEIGKDIAKEDSRWVGFTDWNSGNSREFVQSSALDWFPPEDDNNKFSVIFSGSTLHWIVAGENGKALFNKIRDALQPEGWFVAHTPGCENFYPLFTRIIIAALNDIKELLKTHHSEDVRKLGSLPDIINFLKNHPQNQGSHPNTDASVEEGSDFETYWNFRRKAHIAFWRDYKAIRADFMESGLQERLLLRGLDWELVSTDEFYSHWASAGKSVFWKRFQAIGEDGGCKLYDQFEDAFKNILGCDEKLKMLNVNPLYIEGKKYIRHYCHRYYIILQKAEQKNPRKHGGISSLISLPIQIAHDVAKNCVPTFASGDERQLFSDSATGWQQPFRSLHKCLPADSMKYSMFLRERDVGSGETGREVDRRALLQNASSVDSQWQYKIDEALKKNVGIAKFTEMREIAENALPVCLLVVDNARLPDYISEMIGFTDYLHTSLKETANPVYIIASTTNPRQPADELPEELNKYCSLLEGATVAEVSTPVSFMLSNMIAYGNSYKINPGDTFYFGSDAVERSVQYRPGSA